jgi:predicted dehydrogenase
VAGLALVSAERGYEHFHPDVASFYGPGGGPALDLGPYHVTAIVAMLGPVARVTGCSRATFPERTIQIGPRRGEPIPVQVPTHVTGALELESGALITMLMTWDVWSSRSPVLEIYGAEGSHAAGNPDLFDCAPRVRRAGAEELPWLPIPLIGDADGCRGLGIVDMAQAIQADRPHRASAQLAFHVFEVLLALQEGGCVEIESRCSPPAPVDRSSRSFDRRMARRGAG